MINCIRIPIRFVLCSPFCSMLHPFCTNPPATSPSERYSSTMQIYFLHASASRDKQHCGVFRDAWFSTLHQDLAHSPGIALCVTWSAAAWGFRQNQTGTDDRSYNLQGGKERASWLERKVAPGHICMKFTALLYLILGRFTWELEFFFDHASEVHSYGRAGAHGFSWRVQSYSYFNIILIIYLFV
jgi:hypothetical protein